jgi:hypothetical protein
MFNHYILQVTRIKRQFNCKLNVGNLWHRLNIILKRIPLERWWFCTMLALSSKIPSRYRRGSSFRSHSRTTVSSSDEQIKYRTTSCTRDTCTCFLDGRPVRSSSWTSAATCSDKLYSYYAATVYVSPLAVNLDGGEIGVFRLQNFYHTTDFFRVPSFLYLSRCTSTYAMNSIWLPQSVSWCPLHKATSYEKTE